MAARPRGSSHPAAESRALWRRPRHPAGLQLDLDDRQRAGQLRRPLCRRGCQRVDDAALMQVHFQALEKIAESTSMTDRLMFGTDWYMEAINPGRERVSHRVPASVRRRVRLGAER